MSIFDLKNKKITVMGLGLHGGGIGTVRFLHSAGAHITVTDIKSREELAPSLEKLKDLKGVEYIFQQHRPESFTASDMVVKNPAARWSNKYIQMAINSKVPVEMDSSLFFKFCPCPIIGITGTKGKTTTASLIFEILKVAGKNPVKVGIGQTSVLDKLKDLKKDSIVVFELSSWRLSALGRAKISPQIAVITNIFPDHLNYYKSMEEYIRDKKYIFLNQDKKDSCVISGDSAYTEEFEKEIKARLIKFSKNKITNGWTVYLDGGIIYFNDGIDEKKIISADEIKIPGEHNTENVLAAIAAGIAAGAEISAVKKAVASFSGIAHRLELVRELNGVKYVNDTAATTPESAIAGINSFSAPVILIAGGSDKNLNMEEWAKTILQKTKGAVFLAGAGTDKIVSFMKKEDANQEFTIAESMEKAVELAHGAAEKGDVILLSPGAASFGIFANEFDRGEKFKEAVGKLK